MATDLSLDWLISVDDYVLEPPHLWVDRVPAKDRERAPHLIVEGDMDCWVYDGKRHASSGLSAVAGQPKEEFSPEPVTYAETRPGCYDPKARVDDMDRALFRDHVFGCFIDDAHGIASIDEIGEDNIMGEADHPHSDSTWPNSIAGVKNRIGHLPPEIQYKILRGNAERLYQFTPAETPVLARA
jgi:Amidohydrolase